MFSREQPGHPADQLSLAVEFRGCLFPATTAIGLFRPARLADRAGLRQALLPLSDALIRETSFGVGPVPCLSQQTGVG